MTETNIIVHMILLSYCEIKNNEANIWNEKKKYLFIYVVKIIEIIAYDFV